MRQKNINGVDQKLRKFFETEFNEKSAFWIDRLSTEVVLVFRTDLRLG
jgi:hypothetical protein